jgi:hypothetical protein
VVLVLIHHTSSDESQLEFKSDYNLFLTNVNGGNPNIGSKANGGVYFN